MIEGITLGILHQIVTWLLYPVLAGLAVALLMTLWELGITLAECFVTLARYRQQPGAHFERYAMVRLERVHLLARSGPMLGLMGTLIPLGPGLAALGAGNLDVLATTFTVAFDATVVGLAVGLLGYLMGQVRQRWYDLTWQHIADQHATAEHSPAQHMAKEHHHDIR